MSFAITVGLLIGIANAVALASLARSIHTMSVASKALVAASATLVTTAQAIADNMPASTSDTAETTQDVTDAATNVAKALSILTPLAPAVA